MQLWDRGYWESDDPERGFKKGDLKFTLHGEKLHGSWVLVRMRHDRNGGKRTNWLLIKHRDEFAREGKANDILDEDRSVASGRTMEQIAAGKGKAPKPFMLAKAGTRARPMRCGIRTGAMPPKRARARQESRHVPRKRDARRESRAKARRKSPRCRISSRRSSARSVERPPQRGRLVP